MTVGGSICAAPALSAISANVPTTVCCEALVPHRTIATGVDPARPSAIKVAAIAERFFMPMRKTTVPWLVASLDQSKAVEGFSGSSCPVTIVSVDANVRCVTGIPAYAGAATAAVTPGTTSNSIPADARASASSPPRPKTNGSPPFNRTTTLPALARSISRRLIASCSGYFPLPRRPT